MFFNYNHRHNHYPRYHDEDVNRPPLMKRFRSPEPYFPSPMRSRDIPHQSNLVHSDRLDHGHPVDSFYKEQTCFSGDFLEAGRGYNYSDRDILPQHPNITPAWFCQPPINDKPYSYSHQQSMPLALQNNPPFNKFKNYRTQKSSAAIMNQSSQENFIPKSSSDKMGVKGNRTTQNFKVDVKQNYPTTKRTLVASSLVNDKKIQILPSSVSISTVYPSVHPIPPIKQEKGKKKRLKKRSPESKKIKKSKAWQKKKELALKNVVQLPVQKENHANKDSSQKCFNEGNATSEVCNKLFTSFDQVPLPINSNLVVAPLEPALPKIDVPSASLAINSRKRPREEDETDEEEPQTISTNPIPVIKISPPLPNQLTHDDLQDVPFGDYIAGMVKEAYMEVMKDSESALIRHKVLAGIVMTWGPKGSQVVAIGTGSKCIGGGGLSLEGRALNDCHAEILARRGLVAFLYDQLSDFSSNPEWSIFEEAPAGSRDRRLRLRDHIKFHLYVSSAPCGDARTFAYEELNADNVKLQPMNEPKWKPTSFGPAMSDPAVATNPEFYRRRQGVLRTKLEAGEGSIPSYGECGIQTWDGILQGERLRTMSCSDKLARWNVVGLQGSLLSHLILPVYLSTVIIGSLYHPVHLRRALITRVEKVQDLPSSFSVSRPILTTTSEAVVRRAINSPKHGICWSRGWDCREVITTISGTLEDGSTSRVSKRSLFERFISLVSGPSAGEWVNSILLMEPHVSEDGQISYLSLKRAARDFRQALDRFQTHLTKEGRGCWVKKPIEQDGFEISFPKRFLE